MVMKKTAKKAPAKKGTAKKKATKKALTKKKPPSAALVRDLAAVFEAHNWSGDAIGLAEAAGTCPDGQTPVEVNYQDSNGDWVTKTVCV
jgi:hypothetical protein